MFRQTGDRTGEARALGNLGNIALPSGRYQEAVAIHRQALACTARPATRSARRRALGNLGLIEERLGRYEQAARHHRQALALAREIGDRDCECVALGNLGDRRLAAGPLPAGRRPPPPVPGPVP